MKDMSIFNEEKNGRMTVLTQHTTGANLTFQSRINPNRKGFLTPY
jgi:hypothetical protein